MTTFDNREKAAENKYVNDQEHEFRVNARRTKLLGLWAAGCMNLSGTAAEDYARNLIASTISANEDAELLARIKADLSSRGVPVSEHDLKEELYKVTQIAKEQLGQK